MNGEPGNLSRSVAWATYLAAALLFNATTNVSAQDAPAEDAPAEAQAAAEEAEQASSAGSWTNVIFGRGPRGGRSMGEQVARDVGRSIMRRMITQVTRAAMRGLGLRR